MSVQTGPTPSKLDYTRGFFFVPIILVFVFVNFCLKGIYNSEVYFYEFYLIENQNNFKLYNI